MNALTWVLQVFLAVQFLFHGWLFISPPPMMADAIGMLGLGTWFRQFIGVAEVLAAIGLIGPGSRALSPGRLRSPRWAWQL